MSVSSYYLISHKSSYDRLNLEDYIYELIFFERDFFEGVFRATDDKLQFSFLLHDLVYFLRDQAYLLTENSVI